MLVSISAALVLAPSSLRLARIFSDHMVLQRAVRVPIFGVAEPGTPVRVELAGQAEETVTGPDGRWLVELRPLSAGGPYTLKVTGDGTWTVDDVLVGEVWLASGQSNMEWRVAWASEPELELSRLDPRIRIFTVARQSTEDRAPDVSGAWEVPTRQSVFQFTAVGYAFAQELRRALGVPVGIIHSSWGGTPAESWLRRSTQLNDPEFAPPVMRYLESLSTFPARRAEYEAKLDAYNELVFRKDGPNLGYQNGWALPSLDERDWRKTSVPGTWERSLSLTMDGSIWYRKSVEIPPSWAGKALRLELGRIDDLDHTYFNGSLVGRMDPREREPNQIPRSYRVSPGMVRAGTNVIAVRVFDRLEDGGFLGDAVDMKLSLWDGSEPGAVELSGEWLYRVETRLPPPDPALLNNRPVSPVGPGHPQAPGSLWNGMIGPLVPYGLRGIIWYQGESNAPRAGAYSRLFPLLIRDWRSAWGSDLPFYFVQLANFRARRSQPSESDWAELREAQLKTLSLPKTGMAVTIDIGDANDIHPKEKREVGRRLALHALSKDYGRLLLRSGPIFRGSRLLGREIHLSFDFVGSRLATSDGRPLRGFAIAGPDRAFRWADARISGPTVVVSHPDVPQPVAVRYNWADNPDGNLVNSVGLPASPFRTDNFPLTTRRSSP